MHELWEMHLFHAAVFIKVRIIITMNQPSLVSTCNKLQVDSVVTGTLCVSYCGAGRGDNTPDPVRHLNII